MIKHKHAALLTVLGPSTALPGFRAPPSPGFSPRIQTRCFKKTVKRFRRGDDAILLWSSIWMDYLQCGQYELPGGAQDSAMTVGQI